MAESPSTQILLLASDLLGETLAERLSDSEDGLVVVRSKEQLNRHPSLVIWSVESLESISALKLELNHLQKNWFPAPLLLLIPANLRIDSRELLELNCSGLLQAPDLKTLKESIKTLLGGGRVISVQEQSSLKGLHPYSTIGLGQWLLVSGLQQINNDLQAINDLLDPPPENLILRTLLDGRKRELNSAKSLLVHLWGPLNTSLDPTKNIGQQQKNQKSSQLSETNISLQNRSAVAVWDAIRDRLKESIGGELTNTTGKLLAIEGLATPLRTKLLLSLISQLDEVFQRLRKNKDTEENIYETWLAIQPELRKQSLRAIIGNYVRIPKDGELKTVTDQLLAIAELEEGDEELPEPHQIIDPLLLDKPVPINAQLLAADDPRALIHLENHISNWIVRTAEIVSAEMLGACAEWPELRRYLLLEKLISTRELERLRNQLNSQTRWRNLVLRPIELYESKRLLYKLHKGSIKLLMLTEPRDEELRSLGWLQQQVALLLEARDALAPQLQALIKHIGDLMVVVLTKVVGRSIGLIGRGIAQGMGRSLGRS